jgi:hypothetical protein
MWYQGEVDDFGDQDGMGIGIWPDCIELSNFRKGKRHGKCIMLTEQRIKMETKYF